MAKAFIARPLSRAELLEASVVIEARMLEGESRADIMDALGYSPDQFAEAKKFLLDAKSDEVRNKTREHTYVEYVLEQRGTINKLDNLVRDLDKASQYNAVVGALRLRSDLIDKIIDRGHDFGFIKKTPERKEIIAGILIADMSTADLKKEILGHGKLTRDLMEKFGESSFLALPDKPLHYEEPAPADIIAKAEELDDEEDLDAELKRKAKAAALAPKSKKKRPKTK